MSQLSTEELIERGLPVYTNEIPNWQNTELIQSVGHRIRKKWFQPEDENEDPRFVWTAVPQTNSNQTNFDTWLRGIVTNFESNIGPVNNDGSRTIMREGLAIHLYFNEDGSLNHANVIGVALLQMLLAAYPTASPEVMQLAATVRYEFIQKEAFNLTSLLPDINFDGVTATNNTLVDGVHYLDHPNFPTLLSWVLDVSNFDDRNTGKSSRLHYLVSSAGVTLIIKRANGTGETIENIDPSFVHSWMIAETDDAQLLGDVYDPLTNIIWVDFDKTVCSLQLMLSLDFNLKAEGAQSPVFSLK